MYKIAREHKLTVNELANLNPQIKNINLIYTGETIITNKNERDLLTRIVHAEAEGESHEGKVAVALVVLNRVDSKDFPNTITDVIYQKGQFSPVSNGRINTITPTNASVVAVN
ncbi:cell wall hydrolase, partial [Pseudomonas sp. SIMBA_059]